MKILIIVPDLVVGGVTTVVLNSIYGLKSEMDCEVLLLSLKSIESSFNFVEVKSLNVRNFKDYFFSLKKLNDIIKEFKPDIIHSHTYYSHMLIRLHRVVYGRCAIYIVNEHGTFVGNKNNFSWFLFKLTKALSDIYINVSMRSLKSYIDNSLFRKDKSIVVYNGIDCEKFVKNIGDRNEILEQYSLKKEKILLGYVGRLSEEKDLGNLIRAIALINKERGDFRLMLVGDGPCREELILLIQELDLVDKVILTGSQSNVKKYMSAFDILVLSSKTEGLPTVVLEAMSMECLVVSTDCGGVREIFSGLPHFICETGSSQKLAEQINFAINLDRNMKDIYTKAYRERVVSEFSIIKARKNLYSVYKKFG
jgi:glycosyltransferase involved in cell wall biosynthesis